MAIGKIKASRVNSVDAPTYVGEEGILFYNFANGVIRLSDGTTPGGVSVPYTIASNTVIGGIKAGPGANIATDGTLTIDTSGLPLSIGNLDFIDTTISTLNPNVNLNIETNGTGNINLIGAVNFYKPNGPIESRRPFFGANSDGQITILVPIEDPVAGGVEIIGSATGNIIQPGLPGTMLHLTGNPNVAVRMYMDGIGDYATIVGRRFNGNVATPTQVLANQDVLRFNATAATTAGLGNVALAQIRFTALEDQTPTAQGSSITFTVTPIGSEASARVDVANITVANGVTATKFTTSGNIAAGNLIVSGNILGNAVTTTATIGAANIGSINLSPGTITKAPLTFAAGPVLTNAVPGTIEFDGNVFYGTPSDTSRGLIPSEQWYVLQTDRTINYANTVAQSLYGVSPYLVSNTRYWFRMKAYLTRTTGDNNTTLNLAWGGNVGLSRVSYAVQSKTGALGTVGSENTVEYNTTSNFATNVVVSAVSNPPSSTTVVITGIIDTTTSGILTPLITWSGATAAGTVTISAGSNFQIWPLSVTGANTIIGNWAVS